MWLISLDLGTEIVPRKHLVNTGFVKTEKEADVVIANLVRWKHLLKDWYIQNGVNCLTGKPPEDLLRLPFGMAEPLEGQRLGKSLYLNCLLFNKEKVPEIVLG